MGYPIEGRGRVLIEDTLTSAGDVLENSNQLEQLEKAIEELAKRRSALANYLESLW